MDPIVKRFALPLVKLSHLENWKQSIFFPSHSKSKVFFEQIFSQNTQCCVTFASSFCTDRMQNCWKWFYFSRVFFSSFTKGVIRRKTFQTNSYTAFHIFFIFRFLWKKKKLKTNSNSIREKCITHNSKKRMLQNSR